jgi:hypothetical protein
MLVILMQRVLKIIFLTLKNLDPSMIFWIPKNTTLKIFELYYKDAKFRDNNLIYLSSITILNF